jgi:peptidoglycan/LPS O-acetylase OafA/YrhL
MTGVNEPRPALAVDVPAAGGGRFDAIDGLRAIAALSVVLYHTVTHYNVLTLEYATWEWINRLGNFGVSTFFLISGFLLYRPYVLAHFADTDGPQRRKFWIRRFARIMPAYWVAFSVAAICGFVVFGDWTDYLTGYALLGNYRGGYGLFGLGVEWTLVIEVSFYLALPLFARGLRALSGRDASLAKKLRGQLIGLAIMYGTAMAVRVWRLWFMDSTRPRYGTWFPVAQLVDKTLLGYLDWFALGMALAVGSAWVAVGRRLPWVVDKMAAHPVVTCFLALETYWVALQLNLPVSVFEPVSRIQDFGIAFVYGLVAMLLLIPAVFGDVEHSRFLRGLRSKPMFALGTVSYGIYLWHLIVVQRVEQWTLSGALGANLWLWLLIVVPSTIAFATASYFVVERPVIRWSHRPWVNRVAVLAPAPPRFNDLRTELRAFLELLGLCGIAFAQPTLDLLGKNPSIFVTRGTSGVEAIAFAVLVILVPPLVFWASEVAIGALMPRLRRRVHLVVAAVLIGTFALQLVKTQTSWGAAALTTIAIAIGALALALLVRFARATQIARYLAFGTILYLVTFLAFSPATDAFFGDHTKVTESAGIRTPKRVVVIVLDEFPTVSLLNGAGEIDADRFPNFAELAAATTWYRNTTTVAPYTQLAVPAILTGHYPRDPNALPTLDDYPDNLFTLLSGAYTMNVHEVVTRLCPERVCIEQSTGGGLFDLAGIARDLWTEFAAASRTEFSFNEDEGTKFALRTANAFTRSIERTEDPTLDFVHIELPHQPWHYLPTLQDTGAIGGAPGSKYFKWSDEESAAVARQRHLLQVQAVDALLGRTIEKLRRVDAWEDSLVVVTADHGVSFQNDEPLRSVSYQNSTEVMWTPLFVHYPGQAEGSVDDRPVESIDVLPTVADVIDADVPWELDGRSLLGEPRTDTTRRLYQSARFVFEPPDTIRPTDGRAFLEFDGAAGFADVLTARAIESGIESDDEFAVYRRGEYGDLIGQEVAPLIDDVTGDEFVSLNNLRSFFDVATDAREAPWAYGEGTFNRLDQDRPVAVAVNGRVASVSLAQLLNDSGDAFFMYLVPPSLVRAGANEVTVYIVRGSGTNATLDPVVVNDL